jgi:glycosyltransferase involved in cell wall biosynthesis
MLKRLTADLAAQGLRPDLIVDLTGRAPGRKADRSVRVWRKAGPEDAYAAAEHPMPRSRLFRPDGRLEAGSLFEAAGISPGPEGRRVLMIPQAFAGTATLAGFGPAGVDAFAVAAAGRAQAGDWPRVVREAFDTGYVSLGAKGGAPRQLTFLRSDLVQAVDRLGGLSRGVVAMSTLGRNGRFANQLMQYSYVRLYALRHGLRPAVPHWIGTDLYGRRDAKPDGGLRELRFFAFDNDDLHLWRVPDPPVDIDLWGYFQELPACWKPHRELLRRLYALPAALANPLEQRLSETTDGGRRDLVAVHVRRGDYRTLHRQGLPWYRPVPEEWYAAWLRRVLPGLRDPLVYVATDEPGTVLPAFAEFAPAGTGTFSIPGLPADALDFEILRRAGHLAIANSSFSRMAAILAPEAQVCVCPDFGKDSFVAYEPWIDETFWSRFEAEPKAEAILGYGPDAQGARAVVIREELGRFRRMAENLETRLGVVEGYLGERESASREQSRRHEAEIERWRNRVVELQQFLEKRKQALRDYEALNQEQSRHHEAEVGRWRNRVAELQQFLEKREQALRDYEALNREQSRHHEAEVERWRNRVAELEQALRDYEALNREQARQHEAEIGRWRNKADEQFRLRSAAVARRRTEVGDLERRLRERELDLARSIEDRDHLRRTGEELASDLARLRQQTSEAQRRLEQERSHRAELEAELERQRHLVRHGQARVSALAAALEERTREGVALASELDRYRILSRLHSVQDYLKLLAFWPVGWLLRQAARGVRPYVASLAHKLAELAELIDRRQYRAFLKGFGRSLSRAPRWLARGMRARLGRPSRIPLPLPPALDGAATAGAIAAEPLPPEAPVAGRTYVEIATRVHDGPIVLVVGPPGPEALAATAASLRAQTFRPGAILEHPDREGFECEPGDLVGLVAAGARLDPTALELLAAALLSVPDCKFAAASGEASETGGARIAACLIPGRIWREHGRPTLAAAETGERFLADLGAAMQGVTGQGLLLPGPLVAWAAAPDSGFDGSAWPAVRAAPDQWQLWSASALDGARRIEAFIGSMPARRDEGDARPHLLVVVPWLPVGGSEIVLLEVLEHVAETWAISIVTTLPSDHAMRAAFARLTDEIYHAGDVFDSFRLQAFISGLIAARDTRIVLSSNSGLLYRTVPELKAAHPDVAFVDLLHNDLPTGHIRSAVDATTSLNHHIAVSRRVGEALVARGVPRERVVVVPNGVDADLFSPDLMARPAARAALGVAADALVLAFVGRFSEEKRVGAFAEVVARVRDKVKVQAIAVGEGQEEASLRERIAREDLPIEIVPKMPRSDLVGLYAAADLLVLTSVIEGMPMVVLEAMATGCPAAVTDVGDVRRIVQPGLNGFVAPVDSPEDLAEAIVAAAVEPGRLQEMRVAARDAVTGNGMTKAAMLEGYDRLLNQVGKLEHAV